MYPMFAYSELVPFAIFSITHVFNIRILTITLWFISYINREILSQNSEGEPTSDGLIMCFNKIIV